MAITFKLAHLLKHTNLSLEHIRDSLDKSTLEIDELENNVYVVGIPHNRQDIEAIYDVVLELVGHDKMLYSLPKKDLDKYCRYLNHHDNQNVVAIKSPEQNNQLWLLSTDEIELLKLNKLYLGDFIKDLTSLVKLVYGVTIKFDDHTSVIKFKGLIKPRFIIVIRFLMKYFKLVLQNSNNHHFIDYQPNYFNILWSKDNYQEFEKLIGYPITLSDIKKACSHWGFGLQHTNRNEFNFKIPINRQDIKTHRELYEELFFYLGWQNQLINNLSVDKVTLLPNFNNLILNHFISRGYIEIKNFSLVSESANKQVKEVNYYDDSDYYNLINPISYNYQSMRLSLMTTLEKTAVYNLKRKNYNFKLLEIGTCFNKNKGTKMLGTIMHYQGVSVELAHKQLIDDLFSLGLKLAIAPSNNHNIAILQDHNSGSIGHLFHLNHHKLIGLTIDYNYLSDGIYHHQNNHKLYDNSKTKLHISYRDIAIKTTKNLSFYQLNKILKTHITMIINEVQVIHNYKIINQTNLESCREYLIRLSIIGQIYNTKFSLSMQEITKVSDLINDNISKYLAKIAS